jgi:voltage-gated potassium channel
MFSHNEREFQLFLRRLAMLFALIAGVLVFGTVGFAITEGRSLWNSFVWSLDVVATVGSIQSPTDTGGEIVKVVLIVLGVGTLFYALVSVTEFFVSGHLSGLLEQRRIRRMIDSMHDHYVICGFGRVGRQVARDLGAAGAKYVVIDPDPENRDRAQAVGVRFLEGAASDDELLREAGIERARAVVACVDSDNENIVITLSARELAPEIKIIARASAEGSEKKLLRAGADRVISPYTTSGTERARLALHPNVTGAVELAPEYRMEEIEVTEGCAGSGRTVGEIRGGAIIVALRQQDGNFVAQPPGETRLDDGDVLVAMGTERTMSRLEALFEPEPAAQPQA